MTGSQDNMKLRRRLTGWYICYFYYLPVVPTLTLLQVMDSPKYLEDLTGLTDLMSDADLMAGVIDIADDDTFSVSSGDI